jgi:glucose/arabinose dehydrogenase
MHSLKKSSGNQVSIMLLISVCTTLFTACEKQVNNKSAEEFSSRNSFNFSRHLDLQVIANGFISPLTVAESPDGTRRLFVVDQAGQVWIIANGQKLNQPFIDVKDKMVPLRPGYDERGLLSMAFHPDYKQNGKFYLFYTAPPPPGGPTVQTGNTGLPMTWNNTTRISEFRVSSDPNMADNNSEKIILEEPHPQFNHNGGTIAFGPDGYLYISIGDGGNKNDIGPGHVEDWYAFNAGGNAQDITSNLKGNILRIDVNKTSNGKNYGIPPDNPFVNKEGLDEIYAYGLRNPYRFSFDMSGSKRLLVGDAGQNRYEEISVVTKGGNYGWNVKEGTHCFNAANEFAEVADCPDVDVWGNPLIDPVLEMKNIANGGNFVTVVAGQVYRGSIPGLEGKYLFGNFANGNGASGEVYITNPAGPGLWQFEKLSFKSYPDDIDNYLKGFGQDLSGEVYVLGSELLGPSGVTGKLFKLIGEKKN